MTTPAAQANPSRAIRVAYLINQYPGVSHTFIRREILALEEAGATVLRFAQRGWNDHVADPVDVQERDRTRYLLKGGAKPLLMAMLASLFGQPARFVATLREALKLSRGGDRGLPFYLIYFAEAVLLARWLRESRAQHLHAHFGTNSAVVAQLAARLAGIGFSVTLHGPEEFDMPAAICLADKVHASRFVVAVSSFGRSQIYRWIERSHWPKVKVVHCGLDKRFHADLPPEDVSRLDVDFVCVGRICEQKGQLLLVQALAVLKSRGVRARLMLAGDGPMRADVERRAQELGVAEQMTITGWISSEQVRQSLLRSRAMVLPSFAEGLPVVIMEAMALRRPVISTFVAGIPELVQTGRTGWLVPAGDVDVLADAMQRSLAVSDAEWLVMGEAARERVLERHDIDTEAGKLLRHFHAAVDGADGSAA